MLYPLLKGLIPTPTIRPTPAHELSSTLHLHYGHSLGRAPSVGCESVVNLDPLAIVSSSDAFCPSQLFSAHSSAFVQQLGMKTSWQFVDVLGLDAELLAMVPSPTCAVLLLFPISDKYEAHRREEEERLRAAGHDAPASAYFMRQTIGNACGTIGLIHAIANNQHRLGFVEGSSLKKFLSDTAAMSPSERAERLEQDQSIRASHESSAHEGQTEAPSVDEKVDLHFIALVNVDDSVYELDGRKPFPINHGKTSSQTFLEDAASVCRRFMARDPDEVRFTVIALSAAP
ncbi:ubiquitin carboxyl-terminal hydrolase isozyme L3 isoform X2 [Lampetra fluviatilis]